MRRLGWLNIFDPLQPDRQYPPLDLSVRDERELVQILAQLAVHDGVRVDHCAECRSLQPWLMLLFVCRTRGGEQRPTVLSTVACQVARSRSTMTTSCHPRRGAIRTLSEPRRCATTASSACASTLSPSLEISIQPAPSDATPFVASCALACCAAPASSCSCRRMAIKSCTASLLLEQSITSVIDECRASP